MDGRALLILDACVLIDFWDADPSTLTLAARHVGEIHVAENVLAEAHSIDRFAAIDVGLKIVEPPLSTMIAAAQRRRGLSFQDHLCLLLAKERGWTCVSNDGRLRKVCEEDGVPTLWGLELLVELVDVGGLTAKAGVEVARRMASGNRYLTAAVIDRFVRRVKGK